MPAFTISPSTIIHVTAVAQEFPKGSPGRGWFPTLEKTCTKLKIDQEEIPELVKAVHEINEHPELARKQIVEATIPYQKLLITALFVSCVATAVCLGSLLGLSPDVSKTLSPDLVATTIEPSLLENIWFQVAIVSGSIAVIGWGLVAVAKVKSNSYEESLRILDQGDVRQLQQTIQPNKSRKPPRSHKTKTPTPVSSPPHSHATSPLSSQTEVNSSHTSSACTSTPNTSTYGSPATSNPELKDLRSMLDKSPISSSPFKTIPTTKKVTPKSKIKNSPLTLSHTPHFTRVLERRKKSGPNREKKPYHGRDLMQATQYSKGWLSSFRHWMASLNEEQYTPYKLPKSEQTEGFVLTEENYDEMRKEHPDSHKMAFLSFLNHIYSQGTQVLASPKLMMTLSVEGHAKIRIFTKIRNEFKQILQTYKTSQEIQNVEDQFALFEKEGLSPLQKELKRDLEELKKGYKLGENLDPSRLQLFFQHAQRQEESSSE